MTWNAYHVHTGFGPVGKQPKTKPELRECGLKDYLKTSIVPVLLSLGLESSIRLMVDGHLLTAAFHPHFMRPGFLTNHSCPCLYMAATDILELASRGT